MYFQIIIGAKVVIAVNDKIIYSPSNLFSAPDNVIDLSTINDRLDKGGNNSTISSSNLKSNES